MALYTCIHDRYCSSIVLFHISASNKKRDQIVKIVFQSPEPSEDETEGKQEISSRQTLKRHSKDKHEHKKRKKTRSRDLDEDVVDKSKVELKKDRDKTDSKLKPKSSKRSRWAMALEKKKPSRNIQILDENGTLEH